MRRCCVQADVNPELMMSFMSLMADYVRVHLVVASVTERKQALGMYYCAHATVNGKKITPAMTKVQTCVLVLVLDFVPFRSKGAHMICSL